nr:hypothetical protein [uncultured Mucilaginibacter sp.]
MKYFKFWATVICLSVTVHAARAQFRYYTDSRPVRYIDYTNVEGTPYLYPDWVPGSVKLTDGTTNDAPIELKYNLVSDEVSFKDKAGQELVFVKPVAEFTLNSADNSGLPHKYRSGYKDIEGTAPASFFEVLADGKVQLLKRFTKLLFESQPIGSASKLQQFIDKTKYYLVINGKALQVKNDKKALLAALGDKQAQLEDYIKANKVNFKNDAQLGKLVDYYNTL